MKQRILSYITILTLAFVTPLQTQAQATLFKAIQIAKGVSKAAKAYTLTNEELQAQMREAMKAEDACNHVCSSGNEYSVRLKRIVKGINQIDGTPLNFKVYKDSKTANAFASPDGSVRVYSKLMDIMTDEEILGIIGHEIGHVAGQHALKEYKAALYISAARDGLTVSEETGKFAAGISGSLTEFLLNSKYSRQQETEADNFGYDFLVEQGKNPMAIARALDKLDILSNDKSGKYTRALRTMFSTHPDLKERVRSLTERAEADGYK